MDTFQELCKKYKLTAPWVQNTWEKLTEPQKSVVFSLLGPFGDGGTRVVAGQLPLFNTQLILFLVSLYQNTRERPRATMGLLSFIPNWWENFQSTHGETGLIWDLIVPTSEEDLSSHQSLIIVAPHAGDRVNGKAFENLLPRLNDFRGPVFIFHGEMETVPTNDHNLATLCEKSYLNLEKVDFFIPPHSSYIQKSNSLPCESQNKFNWVVNTVIQNKKKKVGPLAIWANSVVVAKWITYKLQKNAFKAQYVSEHLSLEERVQLKTLCAENAVDVLVTAQNGPWISNLWCSQSCFFDVPPSPKPFVLGTAWHSATLLVCEDYGPLMEPMMQSFPAINSVSQYFIPTENLEDASDLPLDEYGQVKPFDSYVFTQQEKIKPQKEIKPQEEAVSPRDRAALYARSALKQTGNTEQYNPISNIKTSVFGFVFNKVFPKLFRWE